MGLSLKYYQYSIKPSSALSNSMFGARPGRDPPRDSFWISSPLLSRNDCTILYVLSVATILKKLIVVKMDLPFRRYLRQTLLRWKNQSKREVLKMFLPNHPRKCFLLFCHSSPDRWMCYHGVDRSAVEKI